MGGEPILLRILPRILLLVSGDTLTLGRLIMLWPLSSHCELLGLFGPGPSPGRCKVVFHREFESCELKRNAGSDES